MEDKAGRQCFPVACVKMQVVGFGVCNENSQVVFQFGK